MVKEMKMFNQACYEMKQAGFTDDNKGRYFMLNGEKLLFTGSYSWQGSYDCLAENKIETGMCGHMIPWETVKAATIQWLDEIHPLYRKAG